MMIMYASFLPAQNSTSTFFGLPSPSPLCASVSPSTGGKLNGLITNLLLLTVNARSSPPPPPPFSQITGSRCTLTKPCGFSSWAVAAPEVVVEGPASMQCGKGASSNTPSLRSSIQRVRPVERGKRVRGKVIMAVKIVGCWRRRERREWRKGRRW